MVWCWAHCPTGTHRFAVVLDLGHVDLADDDERELKAWRDEGHHRVLEIEQCGLQSMEDDRKRREHLPPHQYWLHVQVPAHNSVTSWHVRICTQRCTCTLVHTHAHAHAP